MKSSGKLKSAFLDFFRKKTYIPFFLFAVVISLLYFSTKLIEKEPFILSIEPPVASPGDMVVLRGEFFQDDRNGGTITLAGSRITSNSYLLWSDKMIKFRIPQDAGSGMVTVTTSRGISNGELFTNRTHIPVILSGPVAPGMPHIESIEPAQGAVGTLVTLRGLNFGFDRGESMVLFSEQPPGEDVRRDESGTDMISCSEMDYDYETWTDQEIQFYVPDGASSGGIKIVVDRGESNSKYFEIKDLPGTKHYLNRKGYQISYEVKIYSPRGRADSSLDIWVPGLYIGLEQRAVEWIRKPEPLWSDYYGIMRYHYEGIAGQGDQNIEQTYWFERFSLETQLDMNRIPDKYNTSRDLYRIYTSEDVFVPVDDEKIGTEAVRLTRRQANPYLKARILYDYLIDSLDYNPSPGSLDPVKALELGQGDSYIYAITFCSLVRSVGVPIRPVAGYLVYNDKLTVRHFWTEFYIEGFGWIPVDPTLGDGAAYGNFPQGNEDVKEYYFGNLDNSHITFSRGVIPIKSFLPEGISISKPRMYSIQTAYEEASGLDYYDTLWKDVRIVDWW